ncbi:MAG: redoxin domain-containing protein [Desulfobulbaceae bacterium]|nr:redoxin domain-containing protein [Desulfobulbaceae bacterium]HIJ90862.1 redoxin domain-containing protein [Deltaproteobacteria bacterium]
MGENCCSVLQVGQNVPDFTMETYEPTDYGFGTISLEQMKKLGKWTVLVFYPADFTFVCSTELGDLADEYAELKAAGAEVVTVSTDTVYTHLAWKREEKFLENAKYPMAADPTGTVSKLFGVYDYGTGLALRGTFIINPEGKLVASEVNFYNVGRNAKELVRKLKASVYVAAHPNEACPARWETGGKTLTPGPKLVGNVYEALK